MTNEAMMLMISHLADALDDALFELDGDGSDPAYESARDLLDHVRFWSAEQIKSNSMKRRPSDDRR